MTPPPPSPSPSPRLSLRPSSHRRTHGGHVCNVSGHLTEIYMEHTDPLLNCVPFIPEEVLKRLLSSWKLRKHVTSDSELVVQVRVSSYCQFSKRESGRELLDFMTHRGHFLCSSICKLKEINKCVMILFTRDILWVHVVTSSLNHSPLWLQRVGESADWNILCLRG